MTALAERVKAYASRYRTLFAARKALAEDIRALDGEVKADEIDPRLLKAAVKASEIAATDRAQVDNIFNTYLAAMGGQPQEGP